MAAGWSLWLHLHALLPGTTSTQLIAGAALTVAALLAVAVVSRLGGAGLLGGHQPTRPRTALGERARSTGVPRLRDPDAPGRARPRAPSAVPSAV